MLELLLGGLSAIGPLSIDMYLPAFPSIGRALGSSQAEVQLTLASYFAGLAIGQLIVGPTLDRLGRKRPLLLGLTLYVVASLACAFAPTIEVLIGARFVQALGGAAALVGARAIVRDVSSGIEAARMLSRLILVMGLAPIVAPLLGGWVLEVASFRAIFGLLAVAGVLAWVAIARLLPETRPPSREPAPFLPQVRALLTDWNFLRLSLAGGFGQAGMFAYIAGSPFVIIELYGVPADAYGWIFGFNAAGLIALSQYNRRAVQRWSVLPVLRTSTAIAAAAGVVLAVVGATGVFGLVGLLVVLWVFIGVLGLLMPNAIALALEDQPSRAGAASAVMGALQFGIAASAAALVSALHDGSARPMTMVIAGFACAGFVVLRVGRRRGE